MRAKKLRIKSSEVFRKVKELTNQSVEVNCLENRNPRNLEKLRIAYKPDGYHLEKPGKSFWHNLQINVSGKYVTAEVVHFQAGPVIQASTKEWAIKKQLYKTNDTSAYINLARVLSQRCIESGLIEMNCNIESAPETKISKFLKILQDSGIGLKEPERFMPHRSWDKQRTEKPWEVTE